MPLTVRFRPFEHASSLLRRLAVRRGSSSVAVFLQSVAFCPYGLAKDLKAGRNLDLLSIMSGFPVATLRASSPVRTEAGYCLGDVMIGASGCKLYGCAEGRVCSACLSEDMERFGGPVECRPYRRYWWDIDGVEGCPVHGIPLVSTCPACGASSRRFSLRPDRCVCGFDLSLIEAPAGGAGFDRQLVDIISGGERPEWARGMTVRSMAGLALRVGMLDHVGPRRIAAVRFEPAARMELSARGSSILGAGRDALWETLDRHSAATTRRTAGRLYGELYVWLLRADDDALDPFREQLRAHATETLRNSMGTIMFDRPLVALGSSIPVEVPVRPAVFDEALGRARAMSLSHTVEDLGEVLALSSSHLHRAKVCATDLLDGAVKRRASTYRYDVPGAVRLMVDASKRPRFDEVPNGLIELMKVARLRRSSGQVYYALRHGRLQIAGILPHRTGLGSILVQIASVVATCPVASLAGAKPTIPVADACRRLRIRRATMTALRALGIIEYDRRMAGDYGMCLAPTLETVCAFEREMVTAGELRRRFGGGFFGVVVTLRQAGLEWVLEGRGSRQYVFRREEAERVMMALLDGVA